MEFDHFLQAQAPIYDQVRRELATGRKISHWMWFIFPQLRGLGHSSTAAFYALDSVEEARRYLAHEVLGPRLRECAELAMNIRGSTAEDVFGYPDWLKFRSSMTLFSLASPPGSVFAQALDKYFAGQPDQCTLDLLGIAGG